jgi:hypothetical protein
MKIVPLPGLRQACMRVVSPPWALTRVAAPDPRKATSMPASTRLKFLILFIPILLSPSI